MPTMTIEQLGRFIEHAVPGTAQLGFEIATLDNEHIALRLETREIHLRPGGTVSGPVLMSLADGAAYLLILANLGPVALALTTNLNIHFMRRPTPGTLWTTARMLKLGQRLAVVEARLHGDDNDAPYAHATVTYSIPPSAPEIALEPGIDSSVSAHDEPSGEL